MDKILWEKYGKPAPSGYALEYYLGNHKFKTLPKEIPITLDARDAFSFVDWKNSDFCSSGTRPLDLKNEKKIWEFLLPRTVFVATRFPISFKNDDPFVFVTRFRVKDYEVWVVRPDYSKWVQHFALPSKRGLKGTRSSTLSLQSYLPIRQASFKLVVKSTDAYALSWEAAKKTATGSVDCSRFATNAFLGKWSVRSDGRFGASRGYGGHTGFDYGGQNCGSPVVAVWPGKPLYAKDTGYGYGNEVAIETACKGGPLVVTYSHLQSLSRNVKQKSIQAGQQIGKVGNTGGNYDCHTHIMVWKAPWTIRNRISGNVLNPEPLIAGGLSEHLA